MMKINPINRIDAVYQAYQKNNQPAKPEDAKKVKTDQLELSDEARLQLQKEKDLKIEQLKAQIESGTYKVDSEKLAEKLLAFWKSGARIDE